MLYEFDNSFIRDAKKLPGISSEISKVLAQVKSADTLEEIPKLKKLTGHKTAYRIRIGEYRIGFYLENNTLVFSRVLHRKDIYKKFPV